jgi:hypothetical protein
MTWIGGRRELHIALAVVAIVGALGCRIDRVDQDRFEPLYRAGKAIGGSTAVGVNQMRFSELLQNLATEVLVASDRAQTDSEKRMTAAYAEAMEIYRQSLEVWREPLLSAAMQRRYSIEGEMPQALWTLGDARIAEAELLYNAKATEFEAAVAARKEAERLREIARESARREEAERLKEKARYEEEQRQRAAELREADERAQRVLAAEREKAQLALRQEQEKRRAAEEEAERPRRAAEAAKRAAAGKAASERMREAERARKAEAERLAQEAADAEAHRKKAAAEEQRRIAVERADSAWAKIRRGMTKAEVKALLGKPKKIEPGRTIETWMYLDEHISGRGSITFFDGRVSEFRDLWTQL